MRAVTYLGLSLAVIAFGASARPDAADTVIRGAVTDAAGQPIAGALVKATAGVKSTARFTAADGRYELTVTPGKHDLMVEAFGFAAERRSTDGVGGTLNFSLAPSWSVTQFTGADIDQLIPDHPPAQMLKSMCINCHALDVMLRRRGSTAVQWRAYAEKQMPVRIGRPFAASDAEWKLLGASWSDGSVPKGSISDLVRLRRRARRCRARKWPRKWRAPPSTNTRCRTRGACRTA